MQAYEERNSPICAEFYSAYDHYYMRGVVHTGAGGMLLEGSVRDLRLLNLSLFGWRAGFSHFPFPVMEQEIAANDASGKWDGNGQKNGPCAMETNGNDKKILPFIPTFFFT